MSPLNNLQWHVMDDLRMKRIAKLVAVEEFVLIYRINGHETDTRIWYDTLENNFYLETLYNDRPSKFLWAPAPIINVEVSHG